MKKLIKNYVYAGLIALMVTSFVACAQATNDSNNPVNNNDNNETQYAEFPKGKYKYKSAYYSMYIDEYNSLEDGWRKNHLKQYIDGWIIDFDNYNFEDYYDRKNYDYEINGDEIKFKSYFLNGIATWKIDGDNLLLIEKNIEIKNESEYYGNLSDFKTYSSEATPDNKPQYCGLNEWFNGVCISAGEIWISPDYNSDTHTYTLHKVIENTNSNENGGDNDESGSISASDFEDIEWKFSVNTGYSTAVTKAKFNNGSITVNPASGATRTASYSLSGNKMTINYSSYDATEFTVSVSGDSLTLDGGNSTEALQILMTLFSNTSGTGKMTFTK